MSDLQSRLSEQADRWSTLTPDQQMLRIQGVIVDLVDYARWKRQEERRRVRARLATQAVKVKEYEPL